MSQSGPHSETAAPGIDDTAPELFPCTPPQQRCWFLDQMEPGNPALNVAVRWELTGRFSPDVIEQAFRLVVARHEVFRTRFVEVDGVPAQEPLPAVDFRLSVVDMRHVPEDGRETQMMTLSQQEARRPFDLTRAPLIRGTLFCVEPGRALLLIVIHQSVFDGWSIRILGRELGQAIDALQKGGAPELPELAMQYADYAMWLDEYYSSGGFEAEKGYWLKQLAGLTYFEIEADRERPPERTTNGAIVSELLSPQLSDLFDSRAKALGCSTFSLGSGVIAATLNRFSGGRQDIVFGTQVAGRREVELEDLIGVFINNLVLRVQADDDMTLAGLAEQTNDIVRDALIHQQMPFHKLVELLNPPRDMRRTPLISTNVIIQHAFLEDAQYGDLKLRGVPSPSAGALYDLNFQMIRRADGWRMSIEYNADTFEASTAAELLQTWRTAFEAMLTAPQTRLGDLPLRAPQAVAPPLDLQAVTLRHPDIAEAAVVEAGGRRHLFVAPATGFNGALDRLPDALLSYARSHLPASQAPQHVTVLLSLPRAADGAPDRQRLLDLAALQPAPPAAAVARDASPATEQKLTAIWEDVLGVTGVKPESHFFELGGHSLLAARMLVRVAAVFGRKPPIATLFHSPTLRAFAREVAGGNDADLPAPATTTIPQGPDWSVIQFGDRTRPARLHGINHPMLFYQLAQQLGPERPVLDVQIANLGPAATSAVSFEQMVAESVAELRKVQPHGPYALMGLCVNGVAALEAARQLTEAGESVSLVAMIDSWAPRYVRERPRAQRLVWDSQVRFGRLCHLLWSVLRGRLSPAGFAKSYNFIWARATKAGLVAGPNEEDLNNRYVTEYMVSAARSYYAPAYGGPVVLFRSQSTLRNAHAHLFGWRGILAETTPIVDLRGWHESAFTDAGLRTMAETVAQRLS